MWRQFKLQIQKDKTQLVIKMLSFLTKWIKRNLYVISCWRE